MDGCASLDASQTYGLSRRVTGTALSLFMPADYDK
jgi:hypothetical protein